MRSFCAHHYRDEPDVKPEGEGRSWITRGVNLVVMVTECPAGTALRRTDQPDEYMAVLPPGTAARFHALGQEGQTGGDCLAILPPGELRIVLPEGGRIARIFTTRATDLAAAAINSDTYRDAFETDVTPLADWPKPAGGFALRLYDLAAHVDPQGLRIQPRVFRCTNLMVNVFAPWHDRRDPRSLSPHWHADFEQASLGLAGEFLHHIRYPWTSNSTRWQPDEHIACASPSVAIIPPPAIHTTQDVGTGTALLVDIFAPPRADFALRSGFVLNEDDYPLPEGLIAEAKSGGALADWKSGR